MERDRLEAQLAAGRSIEAIAREVGRHPSTVAYWVNKHGLVSQHAERHAARGGIGEAQLRALVARGLSTRAIAAELSVSQTTVRHWLREYQLQTKRARPPGDAHEVTRTCPTHGSTTFVRYGPADHFRCLRCRKERVVARRRRVKEILVAEAGGACALCGYARCIGGLQFHHVDPTAKRFGLALRGVARSLDRCREEAAKCVLLCANCHAEVEAGHAQLPLATADTQGERPGDPPV
jgi:transposase